MLNNGIVLLGTAGGRSWHGGSDSAGIATAIVVDGHVYLVDCGSGAARRYLQAGLGPAATFSGLESLRALFVTHLHSDHVVGIAELLTFGVGDGLGAQTPVAFIGPGSRGGLPPLSSAAQSEPEVVSPSDPTPGLVGLCAGIISAFATDLNDNVRDSLRNPPGALFSVSEIELPGEIMEHRNDPISPEMEPFTIFDDGTVRVSATLVNHAPVFPAFAFRFDCTYGSVVVSGDTGPSTNLIRLARGADILLHEVIDPAWVARKFGQNPDQAAQAKVHHLLSSHTAAYDVGRIADEAGVQHLVLTHLAPVGYPEEQWLEMIDRSFGRVSIGADLMAIEF